MSGRHFTENDAKAALDSFLFRGTDEEFLLRCLGDARCEIIDFSRGDTIYSEDSFRRSIGIIADGRAEVFRTVGSGRRYIMNTIGRAGIFGAAALFGGDEPYVTHITAGADTRVIFLPQALMEDILSENPTAAKNYILFLSDRIKFLNGKIRSLSSASANESLERFLAENARTDGDGVLSVSVKSYSALSQMLNIGRASLYRGFDELEARGVIRRDGKKILILDADGLTDR